jgi:hypothetical protein
MKTRLIACCLLALFLTSTAWSEEPPAISNEQVYQQQLLKDQFEQFKSQLIRLAQRLEQSDDPANQNKAKVLRQAISAVNESGVEIKFDKLINTLKSVGKDLTLDDLCSIMEKHEDLHANIRAILVILLADDRDRLKKDIDIWELRIEALKRIIGQEDRISAQGYTGRIEGARLTQDQDAVTNSTKKLLPAGGDQTNQRIETHVTPKDLPGLRKLQEATVDQTQASREYEKNALEDGSHIVDRANSRLKAVLKQWEKILRQLREEEIERVLASLQSQCERMLALQVAVGDETVALNNAVHEHVDGLLTRSEQQKAIGLSDREKELVELAERALHMVQEEGTAMAMSEAFVQIRDDMTQVEQRLRQADVGDLTITIENDIIGSLREMIDALKFSRRQNSMTPPDVNNPGPDRDPRLADRLAQLKMIRSMQVRVNTRTNSYYREIREEQVPSLDQVPEGPERVKAERVQQELKDLATRQQRILEIANHLAKSTNQKEGGQ